MGWFCANGGGEEWGWLTLSVLTSGMVQSMENNTCCDGGEADGGDVAICTTKNAYVVYYQAT